MKRPYDWGLLGYLGQEVEIVDEPSTQWRLITSEGGS